MSSYACRFDLAGELAYDCLDMYAGSLMDALFFTNDGATRDEATGMLPTLPVPVNYPQSAAFTLMPLQGPDYKASVRRMTVQTVSAS